MVESSTHEWFLEIGGKKSGPFPVEQILGLYQDGEIPNTQRVMSSAPDAEWISITAFAKLFEPAGTQPHDHESEPTPTPELPQAHALQPEPPRSARPFVPPPRPTQLQPSSDTTRPNLASPIKEPPAPELPKAPKPELSLMDALMAAKERNKTHQQPTRSAPPTEDTQGAPNPLTKLIELSKQVPQRTWMIVGTAALLCVGIWGMVRLVQQKSPATASTTGPAQYAPAPPPVASASLPTAPAPHRALPPPNPAAAAAQSQANQIAAEQERERERLRDRERERERDERERELASMPPETPPAPPPQEAPPQLPPPGMPEGMSPNDPGFVPPNGDGINGMIPVPPPPVE